MHAIQSTMTDSATLKAIASTILTFTFVVTVGAFTSAIGQNTSLTTRAPAESPYKTVESESAVATHNHPDRSVSAADAAHNRP